MLHGSHGGVELAAIKFFIAVAQVLYQKTEWQQLGNLNGALDLIHRLNLPLAITLDNVYRLHGAVRPGVGIVKHGRVHGVKGGGAALEPACNLAHVTAVLIIEVSAKGKNFNRLRAGADHGIEQARMQSLANVHVSGGAFDHVQYPAARPPWRGSLAPMRSPVLGSIMMHSPSLHASLNASL